MAWTGGGGGSRSTKKGGIRSGRGSGEAKKTLSTPGGRRAVRVRGRRSAADTRRALRAARARGGGFL